MSYFTDGQTNDQTTSKTTDDGQTKDFMGRVVEAKGEHWKDPNTVAKGYLDSQEYIRQLKTELDKLKDDADKAKFEAEVQARLNQNGKPTGGENGSESTSTKATDNQAGVSVDQIKNLIVSTLTEQEQKRSTNQNLAEANRLLEGAFGTQVDEVMERRQAELGLSKKRMMEIAAESPSALMALLGQAAPKEQNRTAPSSVNTSSTLNQSSKRNWQYYKQLRKENPTLYRSPQIQNQILQDRLKLGNDFYGG